MNKNLLTLLICWGNFFNSLKGSNDEPSKCQNGFNYKSLNVETLFIVTKKK